MVRTRRQPGAGAWLRARAGTAVVAAVWLVLSGCVSAGPAGPSAPASGSAGGTPFPSIILNTHDPAAAAYGFTAVDVTPPGLGQAPATAQALVWLGGYDNVTCSWIDNDAQLRDEFARYRLATDPRLLGYFLADEPNSDRRCPQAGGQVRARARLVRALDPDVGHFTLVDVDDPDQFASFRDTADVLATDPYPCRVGAACDWTLIPSYVARLRTAGITRYMAVLQVFGDRDWRWPTAEELRRMIGQWQQSGWCGALTFAWAYGGGQLADHPDLLSVLRTFNAHRPQAAAPCAPATVTPPE